MMAWVLPITGVTLAVLFGHSLWKEKARAKDRVSR
jgi:hypothetical protein